MKGWIRRTWMGCVVALALGASWAHASASGTITFVGGVVAPTCSTEGTPASFGRSMGGCGLEPNGQPAHASMYRQEVVSLESVLGSQDRLLNYYASYAGAGDAQLTIRTYE
ncbi:hypothetical protein [Dyella telluris]|uniref:Type 1 fimbrial protein n=1 Tax=Dyella telluris TaxID=2763498 RepID=A0A7G8Q8E4_9GAMM|nr:hypothetical protein [Dyella telluris]QNK03052.1 hypothetical protein H8F01_08060 [Dyella telluris]